MLTSSSQYCSNNKTIQ